MYKVLILILALSSTGALAQTKRIVTYIDDVQEERKSTRWTLTEWLRIKERMKLMDLWLAMFSKPQQKFAPELSFSYFRGVGDSKFDLGTATNFDNDKSRTQGPSRFEEGRMQFWFTNAVTAATGVRTLDIDLGVEGRFHNRFMVDDEALADPLMGNWRPGTEKITQAGLNLRIFGANSQDSSLVGKIGKFDRDSGLIGAGKVSGNYWGGEISLYLLSILGAEANYYNYMDGKHKLGDSVDYFGFIEIYNVRVGYGQSHQNWEWKNDFSKLKTHESDRFVMARLYF